jgi:hypothetical protein
MSVFNVGRYLLKYDFDAPAWFFSRLAEACFPKHDRGFCSYIYIYIYCYNFMYSLYYKPTGSEYKTLHFPRNRNVSRLPLSQNRI